MTACIKCHDNAVSDADAIRESVERTEALARKVDPVLADTMLERAEQRAALEEAGLCTYCAVTTRDEARDGAQGSN